MKLAAFFFLAVVASGLLVDGSDALTPPQHATVPKSGLRKTSAVDTAPIRERIRKLQPESEKPTKDEVRSWFGLWDEALATLDSATVAGMYGEGGTLLPTLSDEVRTDPAGIADYFDKFLANEPRGEIVEGHIEVGEDWATDIGIYQFTFGTDGSVVQGRYSYFYEPQEDGTWKILHHHSSMMPEEQAAQAITEDEVRALFGLWNDALKTGDPATVAARYAKKGVLLPTQSDDVRTDAAGIEDYFVKFLTDSPTGEIIESHVLIGHDWAQDVGVYEFTFGADGSVVRGRYSFIYIYEDGEWMISHHHSSVMPESVMDQSQSITEEEVRALFDVWNNALQTLDPDTVADLYSKDGNLLPTLSDKQRTTHEEIADYFVKFLALEPVGEILSGEVIVGHNWAQDAGIYQFTMGVDGSVAKGRYTFVYIWEDGAWKISLHHSSLMPETSNVAATDGVTEEDVRALFGLWNDALQTGDPDTVARRYTKDAVLLPTVSDVPRDTHELIEDYFVKFLAGKPTGEIIESFVHIGHDWVSDVGIYEFTFEDGSKVKGRYSYIYAMEDGEWKILHHHSSQMPEEMAAAIEEAGEHHDDHDSHDSHDHEDEQETTEIALESGAGSRGLAVSAAVVGFAAAVVAF